MIETNKVITREDSKSNSNVNNDDELAEKLINERNTISKQIKENAIKVVKFKEDFKEYKKESESLKKMIQDIKDKSMPLETKRETLLKEYNELLNAIKNESYVYTFNHKRKKPLDNMDFFVNQNYIKSELLPQDTCGNCASYVMIRLLKMLCIKKEINNKENENPEKYAYCDKISIRELSLCPFNTFTKKRCNCNDGCYYSDVIDYTQKNGILITNYIESDRAMEYLESVETIQKEKEKVNSACNYYEKLKTKSNKVIKLKNSSKYYEVKEKNDVLKKVKANPYVSSIALNDEGDIQRLKNFIDNKKKFTFTSPTNQNITPKFKHAVIVVDIVLKRDEKTIDYITIWNPWGNHWGDNGLLDIIPNNGDYNNLISDAYSIDPSEIVLN